MSEEFSGRVDILDSQKRKVFQFDSSFAVLDLGAEGNEGDLRLYGDDGGVKIHLDGGRSLLLVNDGTGRQKLSFEGGRSLLLVYDGTGRQKLSFDAGRSLLVLSNNDGYPALSFDADFAVLDIGVAGNEGDLRINGDDGNVMIHLDGGAGDITLAGAGCAEDFEVGAAAVAEQGFVMTLDDEGRLEPCAAEYDTRVVGVISGAGGYTAGIELGRQPLLQRRSPLALTGKAHCRVDAGFSPVAVGDLLTTSPTLGHAMRATDPNQAFGATIGKALSPLASDTGLVPILVALQ
jgi:hypothetical protein